MIFIVYGTRAELIKFSPLIRDLKRRKANFKTVDIGQHDNSSLHASLKLPKPDFHLGKSYRDRWSKLEASFLTYPIASLLALFWGLRVFLKLTRILSDGDVIVTHGNAMGVPLAIYAKKFGSSKRNYKLVHMESGLRANTLTSKLVDAIYRLADKKSDVLFAPFKSSEKNLKSEGVKGKIIISGDIVKDVVKQTLKSKKTKSKNYILANITRSVITKHDARQLIHALHDSPIDILFITNPVIKRRLEKFGMEKFLNSDKIKTMKPTDYPNFLKLLKGSRGAITDSTGVEEECAALSKPCIVTTDFLQIPELEESGIVKRTGCNYIGIMSGLRKIEHGNWKIKKVNVLGSGNPSKKIADYIINLERRSG